MSTATDRQLRYIDALIRRVTRLLPKGSEIAAELKSAALAPLTRAEASKFIQVLLAAEDRLQPEPAPVKVTRKEAPVSDPVSILERVFESEPTDTLTPSPEEEAAFAAELAFAAEVTDEAALDELMFRESRLSLEEQERAEQERARAYAEEQRRQFGGKHERPAPEGSGKYIRVWKRVPNSLEPNWHSGVVYGWAWECSHPDHARRNHKTGVVRGGSYTGGQLGSYKAAMAHWKKYHAG